LEKRFQIKHSFYFLAALLFVYILLFEFSLAPNKVFPKPSTLYESLFHIFDDYNLLSAFTFTVTAIYFGIFLAYLFIWFSNQLIIRILVEFDKSILILKVFSNLTVIFLFILFAFWFQDRFIGSLCISSMIATFLSIQKMNDEIKKVKKEFIIVAHNLKKPASKIYKQVYWKSIQPEFFSNLIKIHYMLWSLVVIYEFISNSHGIGSIYHTNYVYNDLAGFITISVIVYIVIFLGKTIIQTLKRKFFFWEII